MVAVVIRLHNFITYHTVEHRDINVLIEVTWHPFLFPLYPPNIRNILQQQKTWHQENERESKREWMKVLSTHMCSSDNVGISPVDVGVRMVSQYVLVNPSIHGCPLVEVMNGANSFPDPWLVSDGKVTDKWEGERRTRNISVEDTKRGDG